VHTYMFGFEWMLLSCVIRGCENICSPCFRLYLGP